VGDFVLVAVMLAIAVIYRKQIMEDVRKFGADAFHGATGQAYQWGNVTGNRQLARWTNPNPYSKIQAVTTAGH